MVGFPLQRLIAGVYIYIIYIIYICVCVSVFVRRIVHAIAQKLAILRGDTREIMGGMYFMEFNRTGCLK
jgi:hypothetical protein